MKYFFLSFILFIMTVQGQGRYGYGAADNSGTEELETNAVTPNLPANRIMTNAVRGARAHQTESQPAASGDFLNDLSFGVDYRRSTFDDDVVGSEGHVDEVVLSLSGSVSDKTMVSLSYSNINYRYNWQSPSKEISAHGAELSVHHSLSENYGFGGYTFFQDIDIEGANGNSHSYGVGGFFTTSHDLGFARLSTSSSLTSIDYDYGVDTVFLALADLSKDFTDWFGCGINASWTDSLRSDHDFDNNYWVLGSELRFYLDEWAIRIGYERTAKLKDYSDDTLIIGFDFLF